MSNHEYQVTVVVEPDGDGYYAHCPGLPGVHTCGETPEEALKNARDAITSILEVKLQYGDPIEEGPDLVKLESDVKQPTSVLKKHEEQMTISVLTPV